MSLTKGHGLYAAIHENGFNKVVQAIYGVRPRYFRFATPALGGGTTTISPLRPITFAAGPIDYSIALSQPSVDFFPAPNFPAAVAKNQFGLTLTADVCISASVPPPIALRGAPPAARLGVRGIECTALTVVVVGHPINRVVQSEDVVGLWADTVDIQKVCDLDKIVDTFGLVFLDSLLLQLQLAVNKLAADAFMFRLAGSPEIDDDQLKVWGELT